MAKDSLANTVRRVLLSSTSALLAGTSGLESEELRSPPSSSEYSTTNLSYVMDAAPRLLLHQGTGEFSSIDSHRSHRSHSSHRSHYSSRTTPRRVPPRSVPPRSVAPSSPSRQLGSRVLRRGMSGEDVLILHAALVLTGDLDRGNIIDSNVFGYALESAVRKLQRRNGFDVDGVVGPATFMALKRQIEAGGLRDWEELLKS